MRTLCFRRLFVSAMALAVLLPVCPHAWGQGFGGGGGGRGGRGGRFQQDDGGNGFGGGGRRNRGFDNPGMDEMGGGFNQGGFGGGGRGRGGRGGGGWGGGGFNPDDMGDGGGDSSGRIVRGQTNDLRSGATADTKANALKSNVPSSYTIPGFGMPTESYPPIPGFDAPTVTTSLSSSSSSSSAPAASAGSSTSTGSSSSSTSSSSSASTPDPDAKIRSYAESMFKQYDKNSDGVLDKDEYPQLDTYDKDKDGKVTLQELIDGLKNYNKTSDDSSASEKTDKSTASASNGDRPDPNRGGGRTMGGRDPGRNGRTASASAAGGARRYTTPTDRLPEGLPSFFYQKSRDGQVLMSDYATAWTNETAAEFARYDLNGDGVITVEECLKARR